MDLREEINKYTQDGYSDANAISRVCQDIVLLKISQHQMSNNITVKGGVVMLQLSKDRRRATQDLDLDFIKYSLNEETIEKFIRKISDNDIKFVITNISDLKHQDYNGKRIIIGIEDNYNNKLDAKIDFGIHKYLDIEQEDMYFDLNIIDGTVSLLANSKEQIFVEKLKSLLRFRIASTRYKDIFDLFYLLNDEQFDKDRCLLYINKLILSDDTIKCNTISDIVKILDRTLSNDRFKEMLYLARNNWLQKPIDEVVNGILEFITKLDLVTI